MAGRLQYSLYCTASNHVMQHSNSSTLALQHALLLQHHVQYHCLANGMCLVCFHLGRF